MGTDITLVLSSAQPKTISKKIAMDPLKAMPINDTKIFFDTNLYLPDEHQKSLFIGVKPTFPAIYKSNAHRASPPFDGWRI
jgi:hypothetical protein